MKQPSTRRIGLTLMELTAVLVIIVALAALLIPLVGSASSDARDRVTTDNMNALRDVILGKYRSDMKEDVLAPYRGMAVTRPPVLPRPGYFGKNNAPARPDRPQLRYLFINPETYVAPGVPESTLQSYAPLTGRGWRGPYLMQSGAMYTVDPGRGFTTDYGESGDPAVMDGWHNPIVLTETLIEDTPAYYTWRVELHSAGPNGILQVGVAGSDDRVLLVEERREMK